MSRIEAKRRAALRSVAADRAMEVLFPGAEVEVHRAEVEVHRAEVEVHRAEVEVRRAGAVIQWFIRTLRFSRAANGPMLSRCGHPESRCER